MNRTPDPSDTGQVPDSGPRPSSPTEQPRPTESVETTGAPDQASRTRGRTDPELDQPQRQGLSGTTWIALILGALILIMLLVFILQNNVSADFAYLGWTFTLPLGVAMLFAAIAGMLVMALFGSVRLFKLGHRVRKLEREREAIRRTGT